MSRRSSSSAIKFKCAFSSLFLVLVFVCAPIQRTYAENIAYRHGKDNQLSAATERSRLAKEPSYENNDIVNVVTTKNVIFRDNLRSQHSKSGPITLDMTASRTLLAFSMMREKRSNGDGVMRVLDVGGGAGFHYFIAKAAIFDDPDRNSDGRRARGSSKTKPIKLQWCVVETTSMVKGAKAKGLEEGEGLRFFDNIRAAAQSLGSVDLLLASSSLQYFPDPIGALNDMVAVTARYLFITRTPMSVHGTRRTTQTSRLGDNGPGPLPPELSSLNRDITYPITYVDKGDVEAVLRTGYQILVKFEEERSSFGSDFERYDNYGYFCILK